jgi:hypothetical protein
MNQVDSDKLKTQNHTLKGNRRQFFRLVLMALLLSSLASVTTSSHAQTKKKNNPTQSIVYGTYGCKNQIEIRAIGYNGEDLGTRTLVRSTRNVQLIPYDVSSKPNVMLFGAYDCDTSTFSLFSQPISDNPSLTYLANLGPEWWLVNATWDIARNFPVVLLRDKNFNYSIQALTGGTWQILWSGNRNSLGGFYLGGITSRTGNEFLMWGDNLSSTWKVWRVGSSGSVSEQLTGPGSLQAIASTVLQGANAYIGPQGTWVCDWSATGSVSSAIGQRLCASVPGGQAYAGAFTFANSSADSYWLYLSPAPLNSPVRILVECFGGSIFSCGSPVIKRSEASGLNANDFFFRELYEVKNFKRLGSTQAP